MKKNLKIHLLKLRRHKSSNVFTPGTSLLQLWTFPLDTVFLRQFCIYVITIYVLTTNFHSGKVFFFFI